jgi:hypothetical protein
MGTVKDAVVLYFDVHSAEKSWSRNIWSLYRVRHVELLQNNVSVGL